MDTQRSAHRPIHKFQAIVEREQNREEMDQVWSSLSHSLAGVKSDFLSEP